MHKTPPATRAGYTGKDSSPGMGSTGVGQSLRVGFMNFHNAWLSGLSGGPSACEFRGNYLQTKNAERTERSSSS